MSTITGEKERPYFGVTLKSGTSQFEFQGLIEQDLRSLRDSGIDEEIILYLLQNAQDLHFSVDDVDLTCARLYVTHRVSLEELAANQERTEDQVLRSINKVIAEITEYLKTLQLQFTQ